MTKGYQDEIIHTMKSSKHTKLKNGVLCNEENHIYVEKITKTIPEWNSITTVPYEEFATRTLKFSTRYFKFHV